MPKERRVPQGPVQVDDGGAVLNDRPKRPQRRSFDELLTRNATFGAGLNELDDILNDDVVKSIGAQQRGLKERAAPTAAPAAATTPAPAQTGPVTVTPPASAFAPTHVAVVVVAVVAGLAARPDWFSGRCVAILSALIATAVLLLGVANVARLRQDWPRSGASCVPLTDSVLLDFGTANKFANSCQVREKGLKIVQYVLKAGAYSEAFSKDTSKHLKDLSKTTSIARRFFKFCRWIKHFEDLAEAKEQQSVVMRSLLYFRIAANFGADWAEDVCSLERIGMLPKGTLSTEFMLFAEFCQLALALVEIFVTSVRVRKDQEITELAEAAPASATASKLVKQRRKLALVRLELVKFVSDIGKAIYDCELSFAHEGVFIGCSLFSAVVSTHKNMVKVLK